MTSGPTAGKAATKDGFTFRAQMQETWGPEHPLLNLTFGLKIGPKLEDWFLKLGVYS